MKQLAFSFLLAAMVLGIPGEAFALGETGQTVWMQSNNWLCRKLGTWKELNGYAYGQEGGVDKFFSELEKKVDQGQCILLPGCTELVMVTPVPGYSMEALFSPEKVKYKGKTYYIIKRDTQTSPDRCSDEQMQYPFRYKFNRFMANRGITICTKGPSNIGGCFGGE